MYPEWFGLFIEITSGWPVGQMRTETRVSIGIPYQIESGPVDKPTDAGFADPVSRASS